MLPCTDLVCRASACVLLGQVEVHFSSCHNLGPSWVTHAVQVLQRDRLVACMLEHIEEEFAGRVRVRHNMQVEEMATTEGGKVSLKWSQDAASGTNGSTVPNHNNTAADGVVQTEFLVRLAAKLDIHNSDVVLCPSAHVSHATA